MNSLLNSLVAIRDGDGEVGDDPFCVESNYEDAYFLLGGGCAVRGQN
jgi:hypothetical protein